MVEKDLLRQINEAILAHGKDFQTLSRLPAMEDEGVIISGPPISMIRLPSETNFYYLAVNLPVARRNGTTGEHLLILNRGIAVNVLPLLSDGRIVVVRRNAFAATLMTEPRMRLEIVKGSVKGLDPNDMEAIQQAAREELLQESGLSPIRSLDYLGARFEDTSIRLTVVHQFFAACERVGDPLPEPDEITEGICVVTPTEFDAYLNCGIIESMNAEALFGTVLRIGLINL